MGHKMKTFVAGLCLVVALFSFVRYQVRAVLNRAMPPGLADTETVRWLDELGRHARRISVLLHDLGFELGVEPIKFVLNTAFSHLFNPTFFQRVNYDMMVRQDLYGGVPVSIYTPVAPGQDLGCYPTIVYFHGGGWTWLSVGVYDGPLKHFANQTKFKIVAVEYRKAPQHPFPAAYDDCLAVTKYVVNNARDLHVCNDMVMVAGDGAGGNLAAAVANQMSSLIRMQILINPALQMMNFATPSYQDLADDRNLLPGISSSEKEISNWVRYADLDPSLTPVLEKNAHVSLHHYNFLSRHVDSRSRLPADMRVTQKQTIHNMEHNSSVPTQIDDLVLDSRFCPMFAADVRHVAQAYVITSQYDVLRDEGIMYAQRLKESGVKVRLEHYWHGFHGFFLFAGGGWIELNESKKAMADLVKFLHNNILRSATAPAA